MLVATEDLPPVRLLSGEPEFEHLRASRADGLFVVELRFSAVNRTQAVALYETRKRFYHYLPLSCVLATDAVYAAFYADDVARGFLHSHSYTGNPLACRAALAVLDIFRDDDVVAANRERARRWSALLQPVARHPRAQNFRQRGMIFAWEVETTRGDFARWCFGEALAAELLLRPIGRTLYLMPPYIVTDDEMALLAHRVLAILDRA